MPEASVKEKFRLDKSSNNEVEKSRKQPYCIRIHNKTYLKYFLLLHERTRPVHVHVVKQGKKAKFDIVNGKAILVINGKLSAADLKKAETLATTNSALIIRKWYEIFG